MEQGSTKIASLAGLSKWTSALALGVSLAAAQATTGPVSADTSMRQNTAASPTQVPVATLANTNTVSAVTAASAAADIPKVPTAPKAPEHSANYVLGPEDTIVIRAFQAEELSEKPIQIAGDGFISLPLVGRIKAGGLSVRDFELALTERLKEFVKNPQVSVFVSDYRSQPVSVLGDVTTPGVVQLRGRKTLIEVIALAGGLKPDAGNTATITRELSNGSLPLPDAVDDGKLSTAHVNLRNAMEGRDPKGNPVIEPNDVIMVPKARVLYVVGEVQKPGAYILSERDSVTVLQAVALAGGLTKDAAPKKAKILYQQNGAGARTEKPTNVRNILDGKASDVELHAEDILFVPSNLPKTVGGKALDTALNMAGIAVWRF